MGEYRRRCHSLAAIVCLTSAEMGMFREMLRADSSVIWRAVFETVLTWRDLAGSPKEAKTGRR